VFNKAQEGAAVISALLDRPGFSRNFDLKDQLSRSSGRVGPLIAEGYGLGTDKHLADYLARARGSVQETISHLQQASQKQLISDSEYSNEVERYDHIGKMLTRWISYLRRTGWKDR
jgi:four helix bundle protein